MVSLAPTGQFTSSCREATDEVAAVGSEIAERMRMAVKSAHCIHLIHRYAVPLPLKGKGDPAFRVNQCTAEMTNTASIIINSQLNAKKSAREETHEPMFFAKIT